MGTRKWERMQIIPETCISLQVIDLASCGGSNFICIVARGNSEEVNSSAL